MKPLKVEPKYLTRLMLLGGQDVFIAETVEEVNTIVAKAEYRGDSWVQFTGIDNTGIGAIRPAAIAGFMPCKIDIEPAAV